MEMDFVTLTQENLDSEQLCCIVRTKKPHPGVERKRAWLRERIREGHVFRKLAGNDCAFIEYAPIETAWAPVEGADYLYLYCLWVQGAPRGQGDKLTLQVKAEVAGFASFVKQALSCPGVRFADAGKSVRKVAVGGGSCGSEIDAVLAAGCDTFVTADLKYNQFEEAKYRGLNLIDAGHFETENPVCEVLERILREAYPEIPVFRAQKHHDETQFL